MHTRQLSAVIKSHNKSICHIEAKNGDEELIKSGNEKYVLNLPNRENHVLGRQGHVSANRTKGGG